MAFSERKIHDVSVISVSGKLMGGPKTMEIHEKVKSLLKDGTNKIIIDLKRVKWLNSQGLGMLIACLTSVRHVHGELKLCGTTERVDSILMMTKLVTVFETYSNPDQAVLTFKQSSGSNVFSMN